jgi:hypothetical protein
MKIKKKYGELKMTMKYICDYCKKETVRDQLIKFFGRAYNESSKKGDSLTKFDLCKQCYKKIMEVIKKEE